MERARSLGVCALLLISALFATSGLGMATGAEDALDDVTSAIVRAQASTEAKGRPTASVNTVRLVFVGDVMLDGLPGKAIAEGQDPFACFAAILKAADIRVANLECVIGTSGEPLEGKRWCFRADPRCVDLLARHFDAVSLANNHTGDYGKTAFVELLGRLHGKIGYFGGGRDLKQAHQPWIVECRGLRVALLGYNEFHPREFEAGRKTPGIAWSVDEQLVADIHAARTQYKADLVIPFMHWGEEHEPQPNVRQRTLAHEAIDAGADLVVGCHSHVTQGTELYRKRLIVYSLGNFVFDGFEDDDNLTGWVLRVTLSNAGLIGWDIVVAKINEQGLPHPIGRARKQENKESKEAREAKGESLDVSVGSGRRAAELTACHANRGLNLRGPSTASCAVAITLKTCTAMKAIATRSSSASNRRARRQVGGSTPTC